MAGRGFAPKDPSRRVDGGRGKPGLRVVQGEKADQPELPEGKWPKMTREWWRMWGDSVLSDEFTAVDWHELQLISFLHADMVNPRTPPTARAKANSEYRLRMAKFGATPEDRARLRIQFSFAEQAEDKAEDAKERRAARSSARSRRGPHLAEEETA